MSRLPPLQGQWHGSHGMTAIIIFMPSFKTSRRVTVPPAAAFAVAADVASYKDFLPLLERSLVRGAITENAGVKTFNAEVAVGYAKLNLRETFFSRVVCDANHHTVTATSQESPFKHMTAVWTIRDVNGQSEVSISIDYAMRSLFLQFAIAAAMDTAVNRIMTAFEARAKSIHKASRTS
jgi:coenzyme Q-binding protein COQ10